MPIDDLFEANEQSNRSTVLAQIARAVEGLRSHAVGFASCGCSTGALSAVGFAEFETALIHHITTTYSELSLHPSRSIEDIVSRIVSCPDERTDLILAGILAALTSYGDQCRTFRVEELD